MISLQDIQTWGPWLGAMLVGALPWAVYWRDGKKALKQERADLVRIAQDAAATVIKDMRSEIDRGREDRDQLRRRLDEVEHELADFRRVHDRMMAEKDAELTILRGENRQLRALLESYHRLIERHRPELEASGIFLPPVTQQFWAVPAGDQPPINLEGLP